MTATLHHREPTPAHDAQPIDHGGVAVSAHHTVRVEQTPSLKHHSAQVLQVHLGGGREGGREGEREGGWVKGRREGGREVEGGREGGREDG